MPYEIHFDIAALFIIVVLMYVSCTYKRFPTWRNRIFFFALVNVFVSTVLDIATCYAESYLPVSMLFWNNLLSVCYILSINCVPVVYYVFMFSMVHTKEDIDCKSVLAAAVPAVLEMCIIVTSPFTHFVMYFTDDGRYCHGPGMTLLYAVDAFYVLFTLYQIIKNRMRLDRSKITVTVVYTAATVIVMVIQYFNRYLLVNGFSASITLFLAYLTLQNPLEFSDVNTGTYNRLAFNEVVFNNVNRNSECSLFIIQMTNIDEIKEQFGMENSYFVIRQFTKEMTSVCRDTQLFHLFGCCYVYICRDKKEAFTKADALLNYMQSPVYVDEDHRAHRKIEYPIEVKLFLLERIKEIQIQPQLSIDDIIGVIRFAVTGPLAESSGDLQYIGTDIVQEYSRTITVQNAVQTAIASESFEVFLQPIFDLRSKAFVGAESLIRLKGADGKYIPPPLFIPEAEKSGNILSIGDISLRKTCEFMRDTDIASLGIRMVNVNLSMIQCMQEGIVDHLCGIIGEYGIPLNLFQFEITESMVASDADRFASVMNEFFRRGIPLALDDYGTGYSNTARIMHYRFSEVKFDKSLIDTAVNDTGNMIYLKHLMSMVKEAGMLVLAEGVESVAVSDMLEGIGCDLIQGYYYAKPMRSDVFASFMHSVRKS